MLLPGSYDLSVTMTDREALHVYDYRHRTLRFDVDLGHPHESFGGIVSLGGNWSIDGRVEVETARG
jgi:hypothetical protein